MKNQILFFLAALVDTRLKSLVQCLSRHSSWIISRSFAGTWLCLGVSLCFSACARAQTGVAASSVKITASSAITGVYINGTAQTLGANSANWKKDDNYGAVSNLQVLAVSCTNTTPNTTDAGFIGVVALTDGRHVVTDGVWKAYYSSTGGAPPADENGNQWYQLNYDDSSWGYATVDGWYGIPPWGTNSAAPYYLVNSSGSNGVWNSGQAPSYGADMRSIVSSPQFGSIPAWDANWIWSGNAAFGVSPVYFRRTFAATAYNTAVPPTCPDECVLSAVTKTGATLTWNPSFSPSSIAKYNIYWNGLLLTTSTTTSCNVTGLNINAHPQNYFYVTSVDANGNESTPTPFLVAQSVPSSGPTAPANVHITARTAHGFTLEWDPASSPEGINDEEIVINDEYFGAGINCSSSKASDSTYILAGTSVPVSLVTYDTYGKTTTVSLGSWFTLPASPTTINPPTNLAVTASTSTTVTLGWTASTSSGVTGYRIFKNGLPIATSTTTSYKASSLTSSKSYYFYVTAYDGLGNESVPTAPLPAMAGGTIAPSAPVLFDGGRSDSVLGVRWTRPTDMGTFTSYTLKQWVGSQPSGTETDTPISDPYSTYYTATLTGTYTFELQANGLNGLSSISSPITLTTVTLPQGTPILTFAYGYKAQKTPANLTSFITDAIAQGCTAITAGGNFVSQDGSAETTEAGDIADWTAATNAINAACGSIPFYPTPDTHDDEFPVGDTMGVEYLSQARYDFYENAMGPLQYSATLQGVRLISAPDLSVTGGIEYFSPRTRQCQQYLQQQLQAADADPTVTAIFYLGACNNNSTGQAVQNMDPEAWSYPLFQTSKPIICLNATINGVPPFQMTWNPGQNFLTTASGVLYASSTTYLVIKVYSDRILIQNRKKSGSTWSNAGLYEVLYSRANNSINPDQCSFTTSASNYTGKQLPAQSAVPPWAQNITTAVPENQATNFQLLGRSVTGASLTYTIVQQPTSGTVSGTAPNLTYTPQGGFTGRDFLLYKVNDGSDSNYGWVQFSVQ